MSYATQPDMNQPTGEHRYTTDALNTALTALDHANERALADAFDNHCRVYWGSHGCRLPRGHEGPHRCEEGCPTPDGYTTYGDDTNRQRA